MKTEVKNLKGREVRHRRVRAKVKGTSERPRLCVFRSNKYIYGALVDDATGKTILSIGNQLGKTKTKAKSKGGFTKIDASYEVGKELATLARGKNIEQVVFDRAGYRYTGRIEALARGAREGGLVF